MLPGIGKKVYGKKNGMDGIKIELIHFPIDLLFVAISYTIPKIIEMILRIPILTEQSLNTIYLQLFWSCIEIVCILMMLPFMVVWSDAIEENYYKQKGLWLVQVFLQYAIAMIMIIISLFVI